MHLLSHTLIAIALSLLDLASTNMSTYALPITDLATELLSPMDLSPNPAVLHPDSPNLLGREIHNADYSSGGQLQNTTSGSAPSNSSNMSDASTPAPESSGSVPGKNSKTESAKGKQAMRQLHTKENTAQGINSDPISKTGHGRHSADIVSREIPTRATPKHRKDNKGLAPHRPRALVGRTCSMAVVDSYGHSHENNGCSHYDHYPYVHMRYAYRQKYDAPRHGDTEDRLLEQGALYYKQLLSDDWNDSLFTRRRPTDDAFYAKSVDIEERVDVSGDGGSRYRDTRYFDPNEVDRMLAAFLLSHGIPID